MQDLGGEVPRRRPLLVYTAKKRQPPLRAVSVARNMTDQNSLHK
jgi:hypothetical protein